MRLLLSVGTRPEIIKMAPVYEALSRIKGVELFLVHTGQHYDWEMSDVFFSELGLDEPDLNLGIGSGDQVEQTTRVMHEMGKVVENYEPDAVLSVGDTNSVLGTALAASKLEVPFIHIESGLRSYDFTMPEEINRRVADHLASLNFAPTPRAFSNLNEEGYPPERVVLSGNTIVDVVEKMWGTIRRSSILKDLGVVEGEPLMTITVHRKENADKEYRMLGIVKALRELDELTIVWPLHPRTYKRLKAFGLLSELKSLEHVMLVEPLGYIDFLRLLSASDVVATDSGGVQEESATLKKPCIILRDNTERPEIVELGFGEIAGANPSSIVSAVRRFLYEEEVRRRLESLPNPFGDGTASKMIAEVLWRIWDLRSLRHESPHFKGGSPHYVAFKVEGRSKFRGMTVSQFIEATGYEVISIYDPSGSPLPFGPSTPLMDGEIVRVRGDPSNYPKLSKLIGR